MGKWALWAACGLAIASASLTAEARPAKPVTRAKFGPGFRLAVDNHSSIQIDRIELRGVFRGRPFPFAATSNFLNDESTINPAYSAVQDSMLLQHLKGFALFGPRAFAKGYESVWANKCLFDVVLFERGSHQILYPSQNLCGPVRIVVRDDLWVLGPNAPQAAAAPPPAPLSSVPRSIPITPGTQGLFAHGFYTPNPLEGRIGYHIEAELRFPSEDFAHADCGGVHVGSYSADDLPPGFRIMSDGKLSGTGRQPGDWTVEVTAHEVACGAANNNFGDRVIEAHIHVKP